MKTLPTVPVDATALTDRHLILVDGLTARIYEIVTTDAAIVLSWTVIDPVPADAGDQGELAVRPDATVECVRYADWIARRAYTPVDPWESPSDLDGGAR